MVSESVSVDFEVRSTGSNRHEGEMNSEEPVKRKSKKKKQKKNKVSPDSGDIKNETPHGENTIGDKIESAKEEKRKRGSDVAPNENDEQTDSLEKNVNGEQEDSESTEKKRKRKRKKKAAADSLDTETVSEKLIKKSSNEVETEEGEEEEENEGAEKKPKGPSKRQLKKEKAQQREIEKRTESKKTAAQRGLNYVSMWKHARSSWKFEKLRQIWLMDHLLDENLVPDSFFPTALEYFEGCKGMARQQLLKKGMAVIAKVEAEEDEEQRDKITQSALYKRARELLQALPTET